MSHANCCLFQLGIGCCLQNLVQGWNERLAALQREALLANKLGLQEGLEGLCLVELVQDSELLFLGWFFVGLLEFFLEPAALLRILDVHVLDADGAAVGVAKDAKNVAELCLYPATKAACLEGSVKIPKAEAVVSDV